MEETVEKRIKTREELLKNNEDVIVKIQRPNIEETIKSDIEILRSIASALKDLYKDNALSLWITGDQLMKGAAYNSVDIGLKMIELGLLK